MLALFVNQKMRGLRCLFGHADLDDFDDFDDFEMRWMAWFGLVVRALMTVLHP